MVGECVQAKRRSSWHTAHIKQTKHMSGHIAYLVHFVGMKWFYDEWLGEHQLFTMHQILSRDQMLYIQQNDSHECSVYLQQDDEREESMIDRSAACSVDDDYEAEDEAEDKSEEESEDEAEDKSEEEAEDEAEDNVSVVSRPPSDDEAEDMVHAQEECIADSDDEWLPPREQETSEQEECNPRWRCDYCTKTFGQLSSAREHMATLHSCSRSALYTCRVCYKLYYHRGHLRTHEERCLRDYE